jgi:hypothetical protein
VAGFGLSLSATFGWATRSLSDLGAGGDGTSFAPTITSIYPALAQEINIQRGRTCLHDAVVDFQAIKLFGSLGCSGGLRECESGNAAALAIWSVRELNLLDGSNGL